MNMETKRIKKNKREQKRVKLLHNAFKELQELLPSPNYQKTACTKAQILKDASMYIRFLKLKLQNVEEKRTEDSSDNFQVRPSCVFATEVSSCVLYILSKESELLNLLVCCIECIKCPQTEIEPCTCLITVPTDQSCQ